MSSYLSRPQLTALLRLAGKEGLSRQQIVKRALVRELIQAGLLPDTEMVVVESRQKLLVAQPHSSLKPVGQLRMSKEITEEEEALRKKKERERESLQRLAENNRRIAKGLPTLEEEESSKKPVVRRGRAKRRRKLSVDN